MDLDGLIASGWLAGRHHAVLATSRRDGTPQTSNVSYAFDGTLARVSVTDDRAKTNNLRRNPHGVLHVLGETFWQYAALTISAALSEVTTQAGDAAGEELLETYEAITGKRHPDPDEFFRAMVDEHRLVLRLTPVSAVAAGLGG